MKLSIFNTFFFFLFAVFSLEATMVSRTQVIMGTFITVSLDINDSQHIQKSFDIFKAVDSSLSSYKINSNIYNLNLHKSSKLNQYTYEALSLSKKYYKDTDGYFDISIGSITKDLFSFGENERVPSLSELSEAVININGLDFNHTDASIDKNIKIDLGGMGKGFGVDKVTEYLKSENVKKARVVASGDIRCLGRCEIKVQDPFSHGIIASFKTLHQNTGISTSGNYNRYVHSPKNNHLINPKEKTSQENFISITLVSTMKSSKLDAYATAVSVMPRIKAYKFLKSLNLAYIILQSDLKMIYSHSLFEYVEDLSIKYTHKK